MIEGRASSYQLGAEMNFIEMSVEHLGIEKNLDLVAGTLVECGKCFSPKQVDDMLVACDRGENPFHLRTDGWANLVPIFDGASVFFLDVYLRSLGWRVFVLRLEFSNRWRAGGVLATLGPSRPLFSGDSQSHRFSIKSELRHLRCYACGGLRVVSHDSQKINSWYNKLRNKILYDTTSRGVA